jgi:replicative DNA helicase
LIANDNNLIPADDLEAVQSAVLAAALQGDETCRGQLPTLHTGFEEPYRTIAAVLVEQLRGGGFADQHTIRNAIDGQRLARRDANGRLEQLTVQEAIDLVCAGPPVCARQATAYLPILRRQLETKRLSDFKETAAEIVREHGDNPSQLCCRIEALAARQRRSDGFPAEAMLFIPYLQDLVQAQTGASFQGLDSGFPLLNQVTNGLDTGLWVLAAAPSIGKTTFAFQICQYVAARRVPVLFVSLEQSKRELRTKALARLMRMNSRHIARGGLRGDNPEQMANLLQAAKQYFHLARYLTIVDGDDTTNVDTIREVAAAMMARMGATRCLIVLDYLQILQLKRDDAGRVTSPKDRVDLHVSALRRLARDLDSPVLAISAENRAGYGMKKMDVFKESGGIEYSADVAAVMTKDKEGTKAADGRYRVINFNIVKNRNGALAVVKFKFYPERAEFVENGTETPTEDES